MAPDPRRRRYRARIRRPRAIRGGAGRFRRGRRRIAGLRGRRLWHWVAGPLMLSLIRHIIPDIAGPYQPTVDKVAAGGICYAVGLDNLDLVTAGVKEGISTAIDTYLLPKIGIMPKGVTPIAAPALQPILIV